MAKWNLDAQREHPMMEEAEADVVNQPPHYGNGKIECIDYMKDNMDHMMFMG